MSINITKAKILKGSKDKSELVIEGTETNDKTKEKGSLTHTVANANIHPDLIQAFKRLNIHAALLSEMIPVKIIKQNTIDSFQSVELDKFHVSGYSMSKDGESVILTFSKELSTGKKLAAINTPSQRLSEEENDYPFVKQLNIALTICEAELQAYLTGKVAVEQIDMFNPNDKPDKPVTSIKVTPSNADLLGDKTIDPATLKKEIFGED